MNLIKYKNYLLLFLFFVLLFYIYKYRYACKNNNKINSYLEIKGHNYTNTNKNVNIINNYDANTINNNISNINTVNNNFKKIQYHPLVKKISNVIIGRYNLGENNNKIFIKIVYQNVNFILIKKIKNIKSMDKIITDNYKLNELIDHVTLIVSRILFKIIGDPLTKILIGQYIIKKTDNNKEIDEIYQYMINVSNDTSLSVDTRMNSIDILNLSNNNKYINISKKLLQSIRTIERPSLQNNTNNYFNDNLNRVIKIVKNKNNHQNINTLNNNNHQNNRIQLAQLLVDRDGTTYPIPPDINVPPLLNNRALNIDIVKPTRSIYDDSQNVHNTTINETTLKTSIELIKKYDPQNKVLYYTYYKTKNFDNLPLKDVEKIEKSIHRINTDTATFGKGFNLYIIYQSLLNLIERHNQKRDLEERLLDELIDMSGKCSTGHLSRLINVLQGFETNLEVKVKININDEIYAKIKHLIEKNIIVQENMDDLMEDMLSENKTIYIKFIKDTINENINDIVKEYENVNIVDISGYENVNKYTNIKDIVKDIIIISLDKYTMTKENFAYLNKS